MPRTRGNGIRISVSSKAEAAPAQGTEIWLHIHPLGLTRAKFLQVSHTFSRAQGREGHGGKTLKGQLMVTSLKHDAQEPRCRGSKG